jgi:non-specific serine/threonine protein kinase/serine/threonine-protein kinase
MTPERWQHVRHTFDEIVDLDASARGARLAALCAADAELHVQVLSLLKAHEEAGTGFLESPAGAAPTDRIHDAATRVGVRAGVYQLVRELGRGGMGEVYLGTRVDGQYTKEVAVKLVRGGVDRPALLERFRNERQILANLDHPNIARLLDGGTTDEGVPYLAMELVHGLPIDEFCERHGLDIEARIALFCQVCAAVQYAHRHLVVHRDIKPGNILVTDEGTPKLLDFGIAKIVAAAAPREATLLQAMTPEYASPEQLRGETISTASDVYSLGVVLYRLLSGTAPFAQHSRTPHELAQAICNRDPPPPSQLQAALRRRLEGDLDSIVLKALRKEPEQRYGTAEQLADDLQRHLAGLPIAAVKGSWRYRGAKFVKRHGRAVAVAAVLAVIAVGAVVAIVREARIAERAAAIAEAERGRAQKRFDDVRQFSNALIFDIHDAIQNLPGATPARRLLLDRAVQYLDASTQDSAGNPDMQRELAWAFQRLAVVQGNPTESNLGDVQASLASDRKALALFTQVAASHPDDVIDQLNVAMMHRIIAFSTLLTGEGRQHLEQAMAITAPLIAGNPANAKVRSERSIEFQDLGIMRDAQGDLAGAIEPYRQYRSMRLDIQRTDPDYRGIRRSIGMSTTILGMALARLGSRTEARLLYEQGMQAYRSEPKGQDAINTARELAVVQQKYGDILLMDGNAEAARAAYDTAAAALEPLAQADPQNVELRLDVAGSDCRKGRLLVLAHRYKEALALLLRAAVVLESATVDGRAGEDSPEGPGSVYIWIGDAYAATGQTKWALDSYRKSTSAAALIGTRPLDATLLCDIATGFVKTGDALLSSGDLQAASAAYNKALSVVSAFSAPGYRNVPAFYVMADADAGLARIAATLARRTRLADQQRILWDKAREGYEKSLAVWTQIPNPARISPSGFACGSPRDVERALTDLRAHLRP